nr:MAG TPA: hypothetical protein [Caudoviricetes sp.]
MPDIFLPAVSHLVLLSFFEKTSSHSPFFFCHFSWSLCAKKNSLNAFFVILG